MTKALFVVVPVLALVVSSGTAVATHSALAIDEATGVINGAEYAMFVPPAWNGRLILYAHGFVDPDAAIALPDAATADVAPWVVQLRETLLSAGYAVAYSSYAENGWAVKTAPRGRTSCAISSAAASERRRTSTSWVGRWAG